MLRLYTKHKSRVPTTLAVFAAVLLLVTSLAGAGNPLQNSGSGESQLASLATGDKAVSEFQSTGTKKVKKNRGFKVSLFLFRNY